MSEERKNVKLAIKKPLQIFTVSPVCGRKYYIKLATTINIENYSSFGQGEVPHPVIFGCRIRCFFSRIKVGYVSVFFQLRLIRILPLGFKTVNRSGCFSRLERRGPVARISTRSLFWRAHSSRPPGSPRWSPL